MATMKEKAAQGGISYSFLLWLLLFFFFNVVEVVKICISYEHAIKDRNKGDEDFPGS